MAVLAHDCPHCHTRNVRFDVVSEYRPPARPNEIHAFVHCGICGCAAVYVCHAIGQNVSRTALTLEMHLASHPGEFAEIAFYPPPVTPEPPAHLPDNVERYFLEAAANVKTGPNAAGAMFRKSLDVALRHIDPKGKGNLINRIDAAAKSGRLTSDLAEWAQQIRLDGNDAVHDEDPFTVEEAETLHRFTELVLLYLFTMPGMLAERRQQVVGEGGG